MRSVRLAVKSNNFNNTHLQQFIHAWNLIEYLDNIFHSFGHSTVCKEHEGVAFTCRVRLSSKEGLNQLWCIRDKVLEFPVNGVHSKDSVLADV